MLNIPHHVFIFFIFFARWKILVHFGVGNDLDIFGEIKNLLIAETGLQLFNAHKSIFQGNSHRIGGGIKRLLKIGGAPNPANFLNAEIAKMQFNVPDIV